MGRGLKTWLQSRLKRSELGRELGHFLAVLGYFSWYFCQNRPGTVENASGLVPGVGTSSKIKQTKPRFLGRGSGGGRVAYGLFCMSNTGGPDPCSRRFSWPGESQI